MDADEHRSNRRIAFANQCQRRFTLFGTTAVRDNLSAIPPVVDNLSFPRGRLVISLAFFAITYGYSRNGSPLATNSFDMPIRAKIYVYSVIAAGGMVVAASLPQWHSANPLWYAVYLGFILAASAIKLRLPGINGFIRSHSCRCFSGCSASAMGR